MRLPARPGGREGACRAVRPAAPMTCAASGAQKRIIQLTGFRKQEKKELLEWLGRMDCVFLDNKTYRNCTHLIAKKLCKSEKFLAACAAGKWILTKEYIINSVESGRWLDETTYEWGYEIEKDTHYSPQMQSAPKRWREELTRSSAPGAFHRWKVVLPVKEGDKRMASIVSSPIEITFNSTYISKTGEQAVLCKESLLPAYYQYINMGIPLLSQKTLKVLQAGKATICSSQKAECDITHIFIRNNFFPMENKRCLSEARYYPLQYLGDYLFESAIENTEDVQINSFLPAEETDQIMSNMQLAEMKKAIIKHMYFAVAAKQKFAPKDELNRCIPEVEKADGSTWRLLEGLAEECFFSDVITKLAAAEKYLTPPVQLLHSVTEYVLSENTDAVVFAKFQDILYVVLQCDPPWKSPSMVDYYLDLFQCPTCKKGTWSFIEMILRSCLYCKPICHAIPVSGREDEQRIVHKALLKFFLDLVKAEVEFLTKSLVEGASSQHQRVVPQTVLLKTFWLGSETSVLFTKHVNILADWVILSQRELKRKNDAFHREVAGLLNAILGTVVEYWIVSSLFMDRNMFHQVADDLARYIAISCDDFSACDLQTFIDSIPSLWLQMYVAEAVFTNLCLQKEITIPTGPLSLQKIVSSYLPALRELEVCKVKKHKAKRKKRGQRPCPGPQRMLQVLRSDKQNQVQVLSDLPNNRPLTRKRRAKAEAEGSCSKENCYPLSEEVHVYRKNTKGETDLHKACISNNVGRLIQLLSSLGPGINVKDFAGWTPLHDACNHGSTVCVREILRRCPEVDLLSQVDGVTPLHDALSNGHVEIGKLLLQHGGPVLLQQRDSKGNLPLDYLESVQLKQELLNVVHPEETIESFYERTRREFNSQQAELWSALFIKMVLNFCSVYNLGSPLTLTLREVPPSVGLPATASDACKMKNAFCGDWLVDRYFREIETFQKLPQFLQDIPENMRFFPGEQMKALLITLQTMVEAYQLFT